MTKSYADIISNELNCETMELDKIKNKDISNYDLIIFGTRIHASRIDKMNKLRKLMRHNKNKYILFVTGGTPNKAEDVIDGIWTSNLTKEELSTLPHFYMQSGICYEKMKKPDYALMKIVARYLKIKRSKDNNQKGFENAISKSYNISSIEYVKPLIKYVKEIEKR